MSIIPVEFQIIRTGMTPVATPLVMKNDYTTPLTLVAWREPALQQRVRQAEGAEGRHGDGEVLSWSYQDTLLPFSVAARGAASEQAAREAIAELWAAMSRRSYDGIATMVDAPAETWRCRAGGSIVAGNPRLYHDLRDHDPVWDISIPVHPVRSVA